MTAAATVTPNEPESPPMSDTASRRFVAYLSNEEADVLTHLHRMVQPAFGRLSVSDVIRLAVVEAHAARALAAQVPA